MTEDQNLSEDQNRAGELNQAEVPNQTPDPSSMDQNASRPRPTPTGRARRAAAASVGNEVHRPRPTSGDAPRRSEVAPDLTKTSAPSPTATESSRSKPTPTGKTKVAARRLDDEVWAPKETATSRRVPGGRSPLWLAIALGVLVLVGAGALVFATLMPVSAGSSNERDQALAAAKTEVPTILSYDYKSFDAGLAMSKAVLTGRAVDDYTKAMTTSIKPNAVKVKAVVQASTDGAGVESVSADGKQVTAVVFGEQKVTNSTLSAPRVDLFRVRATMNLVHGKWLVSKFDQI